MYFAYGFPKSYRFLAGDDPSEELVYASFNGSDNLVVVTSTTIQLWSGGQQKMKLGELVRDQESIEDEGRSIRAWWCPSRRVIAVATHLGHILFFGLHPTKEILWQSPEGLEARKIIIYLQNSAYLRDIHTNAATNDDNEEPAGELETETGTGTSTSDRTVVDRIVDLCGDAKSLGVVLENGTILSFSWAAKLRCSASPLLPSASQAPDGRSNRNRLRRGFTTSTGEDEDIAIVSPSATSAPWLLRDNDDILPLPTPIDTQAAPIAVRNVSYIPAVRLMTVVLHDGRVALLSLPQGGLAEIEQARCLRWIYKPKSHAVRAVSSAVQPSGHYIAIGLAHGRVAIYSMTRILTPVNAMGGKYHNHRNTNSRQSDTTTQTLHHRSSIDSPRITSVPENDNNNYPTSSGAGQPEPDHILSLTEWGYSSSLLGPAHVLRWSPDGKVVAAGYAYRGLAVWTPSGCRVMCTLRQAAQGMAVQGSTTNSSTLADHLQNQQEQQQQQLGQSFSETGELSLATIENASDFLDGAIGSPSGLNPHHGQHTTGNNGTTSSSTSSGTVTGILEGGIAALAWSQHGYSLMVVELPPPPLIGSSSPVVGLTEQLQNQQQSQQQQQQQLLEISFARAVHSGHRVAEAKPLGPAGAVENIAAAAAGSGGGGQQQQQAASPEEAFVLQGADRVLLVLETMPSSVAAVHAGLLDAAEAEAVLHWQPDLTLQHVRLPQQYLDSAFPILHVAVSPGSRDIAVAGTRGLAVLNCKTRKWRLFGDAMQERRVKAHALTWLPRGVVAAIASVDDTATSSSVSGSSSTGGKLTSSLSSASGASLSNTATGSGGGGGGGGSSSSSSAPTLLLFPRDHLDFSSFVAQYPLPQLPAAVDAIGPFLALAYAPLEISLLRVDFLDQQQQQQQLRGVGAAKTAVQSLKAVLTPIRELNILGLGGPLQELTLLPPPLLFLSTEEQHQGEQKRNNQNANASGGWLKRSVSSNAVAISEEGPSHCVLLRGGGILSVLDLHQGTESVLSDQIESYWLPQSSGSKPILPAPTPLSAVGRDDSAAALPIDEFTSPAAKGAAWLERRTSDVAAAAAAMGSDELAAMAAAAASMGIGRSASGGGLSGAGGSATALLLSAGVVEEEHPPVEMPWWTYGARGMQLWFPSSLFDPSWGRSDFNTNNNHFTSTGTSTGGILGGGFGGNSPRAASAASARGGANATDPELEFDKEVYPLGISLAEVSIVGMMQRTARTSTFPAKSPPAFSLHPHPESQPVLPCLLRRLLEQGRAADALELATRHSRGPHFARSLEWLLFTTLEADADAPKDVVARRVRFASPKAIVAEERKHVFEPPRGASPVGMPKKKAAIRGVAGPLLIAAARLVQQFPQSAEIVVSVARKTDAQLWPALFAAAGSPAALCEGLLSNGALQTAACCLLIVDRVEGAGKAHGLALRLVRSSLTAGSYGLAADLLRFLMPPGENELAELVSPHTTGASAMDNKTINTTQQQQQEQNSGGGGTVAWLWSYFSGADKVPDTTTTSFSNAPTAVASGTWTAPPPGQDESVTRRLHRAASAGSLADGSDDGTAELGAAVSAWKVMGRHAWKLLDSGALRELASFGAAMENLHGGLSALLSTAAGEVPLSLSHTTPSAAAIASALFVASNEFASAADSDFDAAAAAESLELTCAAAGCVNHAMALALMLGDTSAVDDFAAQYPKVWSLLTDLITNDVHLCAFSGLLAPPTTPFMVAGG